MSKIPEYPFNRTPFWPARVFEELCFDGRSADYTPSCNEKIKNKITIKIKRIKKHESWFLMCELCANLWCLKPGKLRLLCSLQFLLQTNLFAERCQKAQETTRLTAKITWSYNSSIHGLYCASCHVQQQILPLSLTLNIKFRPAH